MALLRSAPDLPGYQVCSRRKPPKVCPLFQTTTRCAGSLHSALASVPSSRLNCSEAFSNFYKVTQLSLKRQPRKKGQATHKTQTAYSHMHEPTARAKCESQTAKASFLPCQAPAKARSLMPPRIPGSFGSMPRSAPKPKHPTEPTPKLGKRYRRAPQTSGFQRAPRSSGQVHKVSGLWALGLRRWFG